MQLDSISTVERAHRLTLSSRIGAFPADAVSELLRAGRVFEYWAHEACLLPIELWPHFRRTMDGPGHWGMHERALKEHAELIEPVLERIRAEGPLGSRHFEGGVATTGMWNLKPAKLVLEGLWDRGVLAVSGRARFQREYDLAERVIPRTWLEAEPPPVADTYRELALLAVRARGALTEAAIREHWRWRGGRAVLHHHLEALVAEGQLRALDPGDGGPPFFAAADEPLDGAPAPPVLLCPFDNLVWDRPLLERVFGFRHLIEVYKREHERVYGYYVLPLLAGERFLGRADVKAERAEGILRIRRFTPESGARGNIGEKLERAATRLARVLGLEGVTLP